MALKKIVVSKLKNSIASGIYKEGQRLDTERQLSEQFGVSRKTIQEAILELEKSGLIVKERYKGARIAKAAAEKFDSSSNKGAVMLIRWLNEGISYYISQGVIEAAREYGTEPIIFDAKSSHERFVNAITDPPREIKGIIMAPFDRPDYRAAVDKSIKAGIKIVFVDRYFASCDHVSNVVVDDFSGGYSATDHLIRSHNCPVYFVGHKASEPVSYRYDGWKSAMLFHGFDNIPDYSVLPYPEVEESDYIVSSHDKFFNFIKEKILEKHKRTKQKCCIFAIEDGHARVIYDIANEVGLTIGKELFVVGFDDRPFCKRLDPPLSSVYQPQEKLGYVACKLVYEQILTPSEAQSPVHRVLPVKLRIRGSSVESKIKIKEIDDSPRTKRKILIKS